MSISTAYSKMRLANNRNGVPSAPVQRIILSDCIFELRIIHEIVLAPIRFAHERSKGSVGLTFDGRTGQVCRRKKGRTRMTLTACNGNDVAGNTGDGVRRSAIRVCDRRRRAAVSGTGRKSGPSSVVSARDDTVAPSCDVVSRRAIEVASRSSGSTTAVACRRTSGRLIRSH